MPPPIHQSQDIRNTTKQSIGGLTLSTRLALAMVSLVLVTTAVVSFITYQSVTEAACGGTHRLFGFTWAYHLHLKNGGKKEGVWKDAEAKIAEHKQLARKLQNTDGSLSTDYFKGPGKNEDTQVRISTTGHAVEWLALSLTDDELKSPWMQNAVNALALMILDMGRESIDGGALYHAAHGLHIYHERVFGTPAAYLALPPKQ